MAPMMADLTLPGVKTPPPERLKIYTLAAPGVSQAGVRKLARPFGLIEKGALRTDSVKLDLRVGTQVVTVYRASGGLRYADRARWQVDDGESQVELSDEQALEAARRHVRRLRLVPAAEARPVKVTRLFVGNADLNARKASERAIDIGVLFQRFVDGVPVDG